MMAITNHQIAGGQLQESKQIIGLQMLSRSLKVLPYGASVYSKSHVAFSKDAPLYCSHGDAWRIFDVDGNDYVDMVLGLGSVILGHRHPHVDEAVRRQLANGTTLSLATAIEVEAAERLLVHFPDGCMIQWGVDGSDATTGACRLARLVTGRDYVVVASDAYHGSHDWGLARTSRGAGIPFSWGVHRISSMDMSYVEGSEIAAVIIEPDLHPEWLKPLREWCNINGALLIADEVFTWAKYPEWLGSTHHGVTPDLWCLGKSLANGMPVSAIVGNEDYLQRFAPSRDSSSTSGGPTKTSNAFFSSTWAGHPLSMAAVIATLDVMERENGPQKLWDRAWHLHEQIGYGLDGLDGMVIGDPPFNRVSFNSRAKERAWRKVMNEAGVLLYQAHNLSLAHDDNAMTRLLKGWKTVCDKMLNWQDDESKEVEEAGIMRR